MSEPQPLVYQTKFTVPGALTIRNLITLLEKLEHGKYCATRESVEWPSIITDLHFNHTGGPLEIAFRQPLAKEGKTG